jgi:CubicO group peptidase (beta-lactamase class C family)
MAVVVFRFTAIVALLLSGALPAQGVSPALRLEIEELVRAEMAAQRIPGVSLALAVDGVPRGAYAFGVADMENQAPVKPETMFRLASVSKPITAVAALQLWESGKLDLDATVQRYVPSFPQKPWPVTPRQLLGHLGGIRHYQAVAEVDSTRHYFDLLSPLRVFQDDPLAAEPGTRYHYTTYGYVLLGAAIEAASSRRFVDYLKAGVFAPAGMESARDDNALDIIPNRARGYALSAEGKLRNCGLADTSNKIPGGGLIATARDLIHFAVAIRRGALLKPSTVDMMFTPQKLRDGRPIRYGMGWFIDQADGRRAVLHGGDQQGAHSFLVMLPREGVAVALLCNLERANLRPLGLRIAGLLAEVNESRPRPSARPVTAAAR